MTQLFVALVSLLLSAQTEPTAPINTPASLGLDATKLGQIDDLVELALKEKKMPGCVVVIGRPGGIAWQKAFGQKSLVPRQEMMTLDTVFDLASLTKPLATAMAILKLFEMGLLGLDDPVAKHIPEFAIHDKKDITIKQMLTHQSGLLADNAMSDYADGVTKAKEKLFDLKLSYPTGTKFVYSDVNFIILGEVVTRVSKQPLDRFVREQIYRPIGMTETAYLPAETLRKRSAPTQQRDGRWLQGEVHDPRADKLDGVAGHAGLFSTGQDLALFATDALAGHLLDKSRVLKQATWKLMTTRIVIESEGKAGAKIRDYRGLGWDMESRYSGNRGKLFSAQAFGHGGFTGTSLWIDPENQLYVIFLSNRVHPDGKGNVNSLAGRIGEIAVAALVRAKD